MSSMNSLELAAGVNHYQAGRYAAAAAHFQRALDAAPERPDIANNLATALTALERYPEAEQVCRSALRGDPHLVEAHNNLGLILLNLQRPEEAIASFRTALKLQPRFAPAHNNLGHCLQSLGRTTEAAACFRQALALDPNDYQAHNNLGITLWGPEQGAEAEACHRRAIALKPDFAPAYNNLGITLIQSARFAEAEAALRQAIALDPGYAEAHNSLALFLLLQGRLEEGWREHEWRWQASFLSPWKRSFSQPRWTGEPLQDKTLLIYSEQGRGDIIQFARYVPLAAALGARVIFEAPPEMQRLLNTLAGPHRLYASGEPWPAFDFHIPLMSLPGVLGTTLDTIPATAPYLTPEAKRVEYWRQHLSADGFKIGICWQGSLIRPAPLRSSLPLADFAPLARLPGVRLISLQSHYGLEQLQQLPPDMTVETLGTQFGAGDDAFIEIAAVMANLDLVITIDTAIAHLAGALGHPVWVALKFVVPDWRWLLEREDNPWYPTMRLFRPAHHNEAGRAVLERITAQLAQALAGQAPVIAPTAPSRRSQDTVLLSFSRRLTTQGRLTEAIPLLQSIIAHNPADAEAQRLLASSYYQIGQQDQARCAFERLVALCPEDPNARSDWATALAASRQWAAAERVFRQALARQPDAVESLSNLGIVLHHLNRHEEALATLDQALRVKPDFTPALANRLTVLQHLQRTADVEAAHRQLLCLRPDDPNVHNDLGVFLSDQARWVEAEACYRQAIALDPGFLPAQRNLGVILRKHRFFAESEGCFRQVAALTPNSAQAHLDLGITLHNLDRLEEAERCYREALARDPACHDAHNNLGVLLQEWRRLEEARRHLDQALALQPDHADAHYNYALFHLIQGRWAPGWPQYEWRWKTTFFADKVRTFSQPRWNGEARAGQTLLLYAEQGLGDAIQFVRYASLVLQTGAQVIVEAPRSLVRLLRSSPFAVTVVARGDELPAFDAQAPLMSLPAIFQTTEATIPVTIPYLHAEPDRVARWRTCIGSHGYRIGIGWQGSPAGSVDRGRSIPLAAFEPLARLPGVRLISLQKHHGVEQLERLPAGMTVETLGNGFDAGEDAFLDTAAVMASLDLVITSDTAIAHLAGALGRPVWVALKFAPDWRFLLDREDSPWYPTMRLFRKIAWNEPWTAVMARIAALFTDAQAHTIRGNALLQQGQRRLAEGAYRQALALHPNMQALINLASLLSDQLRFEEAERWLQQAVAVNPEHFAAWSNRGNVLRMLGQLEEAEQCCQRALALQPDHPGTLNALGSALLMQGRRAEAEAAFRRALALQPEDADAHLNLALLLLQAGRFQEGWAEYAWRWRTQRLAAFIRQFQQPLWRGESLAGQTLLLYSEQGLGDAIQFARFVPWLAAQCRQVIVQIPDRLKRLLSSMIVPEPAKECLEHAIVWIGAQESPPAFDRHAPLMDIPRFLKIHDVKDIPCAVPYLRAEEARIRYWQARIGAEGLKIGICWQGNPNTVIDRQDRSIPLAAFAPLAKMPGVRLIALQKQHGLEQLTAWPAGLPIELLGEDFDAGPNAFLDAAAVMMNLDLVITCDTAISHVAGALARPVWILLPFFADWRRLIDREDCPWYPTARLFHKRHWSDDWTPVMRQVADAVAAAIGQHSCRNRNRIRFKTPNIRRLDPDGMRSAT